MNYFKKLLAYSFFILMALLLASCTQKNVQSTSQIATLQNTKTDTAPTIPPATATEEPLMIWITPDVPSEALESLVLPVEITRAEQAEQAKIKLAIGKQNVISQWVYALVAPFPTVSDGISMSELQNAWNGGNTPTLAGQPLLMDKATSTAFESLWGKPASNSVKILEADKLLEYAWANRPGYALVPFTAIEPRWKVMEVDGISPIRKEFNPANYALTLPISLNGDPGLIKEVLQKMNGQAMLPISNRDPAKLTTVILTGVTAMARGTTQVMEAKGLLYPAKDIRDWLRNTDITHISNEVAFFPKCHPNNPAEEELIFCTPANYISLLEDIGADVIELTGDHFSDHVEEWGYEPILYTIEQYKERGWLYYGGGVNSEEARKPIALAHNGNRIAFIGCNGKGRGWARANEKTPGAVGCDYNYLYQEVSRLRESGYLPIVTYQHLEYDTTAANPAAIPDFRGAAKAGAVIVSGSQGHQPQAMEYLSNSFIHYGLGNLFFDQYYQGTAFQNAFIDRHVFYDGRYINTELLTITFTDNAHSRPATPEERQEILNRVFQASDWSQALPSLWTPTPVTPTITPSPIATKTILPTMTATAAIVTPAVNTIQTTLPYTATPATHQQITLAPTEPGNE